MREKREEEKGEGKGEMERRGCSEREGERGKRNRNRDEHVLVSMTGAGEFEGKVVLSTYVTNSFTREAKENCIKSSVCPIFQIKKKELE